MGLSRLLLNLINGLLLAGEEGQHEVDGLCWGEENLLLLFICTARSFQLGHTRKPELGKSATLRADNDSDKDGFRCKKGVADWR